MSSRNRPRGSITKDDTGDELHLWNTIVEKIRKCNTISEKYEEIAARIPEAEESIPDDDPSSAMIILSTLEENHRACLKHSEQLLKILNEEPDDLIKNLETLISVRAAFEVESPPPASVGGGSSAPAATGVSSSRATPAPSGGSGGSSKTLRTKRTRLDSDGTADGTPEPTVVITSAPGGGSGAAVAGSAGGRTTGRAASRSGSVAAASVKSESGLDATDTVKNTGGDKNSGSGKFAVGSEVYFRNKDKRSEGEGILCRITNVLGEGKARRYEIQDTEPDEGQALTPWRASPSSLIYIPPAGATSFPALAKGKLVLAPYPGTNTFYKAEVVGTRKDMCRVKFEGEEPADLEVEVERRLVLEFK